MSSLLFIPTYWSTETLQSWRVFDHPFDINEEGTLGRTLQNLVDIAYKEPIMILPVPCIKEISEKVEKLCSNYSLPITVCTPVLLEKITKVLVLNGLDEKSLELISSYTYGGVRNIGISYATLYNFENLIMIDDDECISADYLEKALSHMGQTLDGQLILGKDGCVVDQCGKKTYYGQKGPWGDNWPKDELFNEEILQYLEREETIYKSALGFGGNMVLSRPLFTKVPFDPFVSRGEDDDYLLNCDYLGFKFFFDKDLLLLHLPPQRAKSFWSRQRQDIIRFLYVREKLNLMNIDRKDLGLFMTYFTAPDLEKKAVVSAVEAASTYILTNEEECRGFLNNAVIAVSSNLEELQNKALAFMEMIKVWQCVMENIKEIVF